MPAEPGARGRVIVVDADARTRRAIARDLLGKGFDVDTADDVEAALTLAEVRACDALLIDLDVEASVGAELVARVRSRAPSIVIVGAAALGATSLGGWPFDAGVYDVVEKRPANADATARALDRAVERGRLAAAAHAGADEGARVVAVSRGMVAAVARARAVAKTSSPVLVVGASGAGKRALAALVHRESTRARMPLYAIDCAEVTPVAAEAALFGDASARGLVEDADGATLLIAGVTALPAAAQARLARLLARGELTRGGGLGGAAPHRGGEAAHRRADVRVIATSREELGPHVRAGALRDDLAFRLGAVTIRVPRLEHRKADLPLLAADLLRAAARRAGRDVRRVSVEAMRALRAYDWPGNVRELEATIDHAVAFASGDVIYPHDLPPALAPFVQASPRAARADGDLAERPYADAKREHVDAFDRAYVDAVLRAVKGSVTEAARRAGMDRSNFRRLMRRTR